MITLEHLKNLPVIKEDDFSIVIPVPRALRVEVGKPCRCAGCSLVNALEPAYDALALTIPATKKIETQTSIVHRPMLQHKMGQLQITNEGVELGLHDLIEQYGLEPVIDTLVRITTK